MKRIIAVSVACILACTLSVARENPGIEERLHFSAPAIEENGEYTYVTLAECSSMYTEGYPLVPYLTKTYTFPLGTKINAITVIPHQVETLALSKKIAPAPPAVVVGSGDVPQPREGTIYTQDMWYPESWYRSSITVGIERGERHTFVTVHVFPMRYNAVRNEAMYASDMKVVIDYTPPAHPLLAADAYDLLIVAPQKYVSLLEPLKEHKDSHGVSTIIETTETILSTYSGRDDAEKLKYAIKDAIEEYGIEYVLLVGGLSSPIKSDTWLVPVRYAHLSYGDEKKTLCDLYFADIYKYEDGQPVFDDWDSNGNGIFGEFSMSGRDVMDFHPDVYVGRLACRSEKEVQTVVDKIIAYETGADPSWFKRVLLAGGDTFNDISGHNFLEGEIANQAVADYLDDFQAEKIWWSEGNANQKNLVSTWGEGFGFVHLSGHGSPGVWFVKDFQQNPNGKYIWMLDVYHMPLLKNGDKLPVVVIGGCHNSMYNTSLYASLTDVLKTVIIKYILGQPYLSYYWLPIPECHGWSLVRQSGGGAIATFGFTGYGLGQIGDYNDDDIPDCIQGLGTALELRFFEAYAEKGITVLGEAWGEAVSDYVDTFDCNKDSADRKTIQDWAMLGDPSLHIGGYQ